MVCSCTGTQCSHGPEGEGVVFVTMTIGRQLQSKPQQWYHSCLKMVFNDRNKRETTVLSDTDMPLLLWLADSGGPPYDPCRP